MLVFSHRLQVSAFGVLLLVVSSSDTHADDHCASASNFIVGVEVGGGAVNRFGDDADITEFDFPGLAVGAVLGYQLRNQISIRAKPRYIEKGARVPSRDASLKITQIAIPLLIQYTIQRCGKLYVFAGPEAGYVWKAFNGEVNVKSGAKPIDYSFVAGVGYRALDRSFFSLAVELQGNWSIVSTDDSGNDASFHNQTYLLSVVLTNARGSSDSDRDGVPDKRDQCRGTAEDKDNFEDTDGCPDLDNDQDGVEDKDDSCINEPEDPDEFEDDDGCPELDNDRDGTNDTDDECPNAAGEAKDRGCPDTDEDGVPDGQDRCKNVPGEAAYEGCPNSDQDEIPDIDDECPMRTGTFYRGCPDSDGDRIHDGKDQCPRRPEGRKGYENGDGCPNDSPPVAPRIKVSIETEEVELESKGTDKDALQTLVSKMQQCPKMRIEVLVFAHPSARNKVKSRESRRRAVEKFFVSRGMAADRATVKAGNGNRKDIKISFLDLPPEESFEGCQAQPASDSSASGDR